jgi:hypothetical protein
LNSKRQNQETTDEVDLYYKMKQEIEKQEGEKTEELKEHLVKAISHINFLKEELESVKAENSILKDFKGLAPLTGILNLLNLRQDPDLELLVREIVLRGLQALNSNSDFRLSR